MSSLSSSWDESGNKVIIVIRNIGIGFVTAAMSEGIDGIIFFVAARTLPQLQQN